jgi:hypothetical protein
VQVVVDCGVPGRCVEDGRIGSPAAEREGAIDLLVLDDVWPVFDDPDTSGILLVGGGRKEFGGVVKAELARFELADDLAAVRWGGWASQVACGRWWRAIRARMRC